MKSGSLNLAEASGPVHGSSTRSQSLYRLSYPAHIKMHCTNVKITEGFCFTPLLN